MTESAGVCTKSEPAPSDVPAAAREIDGRWKRGSSPNPGGKTKAERNLMKEVRELAGQHAPAAIRRLRKIMDNPRAPYVAQIAAASAILDRAVGKPSVPQASLLDDGTPAPIPAELAEGAPGRDLAIARRIAFILAVGLREQQRRPGTERLPALEVTPASSEEQKERSDD